MNTRFPHAYVLNVLSADRPGIVAAVSGAVMALEGNIDECSQTVLAGYFTQILIVSLPRPIDPQTLAEKVRAAGSDGLHVVAEKFVPPKVSPDGPVERFVITAFGKDKPGIIHRFGEYLSGRGINIVDLYWETHQDDFVLISQVEIPARWEVRTLQADLEQIGRDVGFAVRLQHENIFVATNQLRLEGFLHQGPAAAPVSAAPERKP